MNNSGLLIALLVSALFIIFCRADLKKAPEEERY